MTDGLLLGSEEGTDVGLELGIADVVGLELGALVGATEGLFILAVEENCCGGEKMFVRFR